jgi:hypothetical protein
MKKKTLSFAFICFFALVIPETSLFADIGLEGRTDVGVDLFVFPLMVSVDDEFSVMPVIPLIDMGAYVQFNTGLLNLGLGVRGFSIVYINLFWPSLYAELNLWRFTLNAQVGGGVLYLFPIYMMAGPYFIPELSLWFTIYKSNKKADLRLGAGAITILSPQIIRQELFQDFYNNAIFYIGVKFAIPYRWKTWKQDP